MYCVRYGLKLTSIQVFVLLRQPKYKANLEPEVIASGNLGQEQSLTLSQFTDVNPEAIATLEPNLKGNCSPSQHVILSEIAWFCSLRCKKP